MFSKRVKRTALIIAAVVLLALLPPFINANRFRNRLASTVSNSIGRPVTMGDVSIRLLPQPGFEIQNFVIQDDPQFSAEPVLRAESVIANLRLTSLWRGRLEIAQLSFKYPSLNLVRNVEGRWNMESILERASQVPAAPTGRTKIESRPRFPYIEAVSGRINFKLMQEKKPHVLMDADFALWLESENEWNMRLEARPTRTDANLGDTGILRVQGSFRRAESLARTPLHINLEFEKAQLGQMTTLLYGHDRGWRGNLEGGVTLDGTPDHLSFKARADVVDFRRYDITSNSALRIGVACEGNLTPPSAAASIKFGHPRLVSTIDCQFPMQDGAVSIAGNFSLMAAPYYELKVSASSMPMSSITELFQRMKKNVPGDLSAQGLLYADFALVNLADQDLRKLPRASGKGRVAGLTLNSASLQSEIAIGELSFAFALQTFPRGTRPQSSNAAATALLFDPVTFKLGQGPFVVQAKLTRESFSAQAKGDADIARLVTTARMFGFADPRLKATGTGTFDLNITSTLAGFGAPEVTGTAQLRKVHGEVDGVAAPIELESANLYMTHTDTSLQKLSARLEGTRTLIEGSITAPRDCEGAKCQANLDLRATEVNLDELNRVLNPRFRSLDWLAWTRGIFSGSRGDTSSNLLTVRASGKIAIAKLIMKSITANHLSGKIAIDNGKMEISDLAADLLGGKHVGVWRADWRGNEPVFSGQGKLVSASSTQLNSLLASQTLSGTVSTSYELTMSGTDASRLKNSATGTLDFRWSNGALRQVSSRGGPAFLQFTSWEGKAAIAEENVAFLGGTLQSSSGSYQTTGKASFLRELDLKFVNNRDRMTLSGTLLQPQFHVEILPRLTAEQSASNLKHAGTSKK